MSSTKKVIGLLSLFFIIFFIVSFYFHLDFPVYVVAGEASPGTWMSGVLLIISATISLVAGMKKGWWPWYLLSLFFLILALDEHFMFHEGLKQRIIFSINGASALVYELPVIIGACVGALVFLTLWRYLDVIGCILLSCGCLLGVISVVLDILDVAVFLEEIRGAVCHSSIQNTHFRSLQLRQTHHEREKKKKKKRQKNAPSLHASFCH